MEAERSMRALFSNYRLVEALLWLDPSGNVIASTALIPQGMPLSREAVVKEISAGATKAYGSFIQTPFTGFLNGVLGVRISLKGQMVGIVLTALRLKPPVDDLSALKERKAATRQIDLGNDSRLGRILELYVGLQRAHRFLQSEISDRTVLTAVDFRTMSYLVANKHLVLAEAFRFLDIPKTTLHHTLTKLKGRSWVVKSEGVRADQPVYEVTELGTKTWQRVLRKLTSSKVGFCCALYSASQEELSVVTIALRKFLGATCGENRYLSSIIESRMIMDIITESGEEGLIQ